MTTEIIQRISLIYPNLLILTYTITQLSRKQFVLNPPFREINSSDASKEFANELYPINNIDLAYLVEQNIKNRYVFVYDFNDRVLGFIVFIDMDDHFYLDLVEVNQLYPESSGVGYMLIKLLENLAKRENYSRITLFSTENRIAYYQNLGYEITGESVQDQNYGSLTPMQKVFQTD